ncbi:MAG: 6-hydroxymethylpterin diphosphokinase MptE-like protein [Rummeliibacillus sp.]
MQFIIWGSGNRGIRIIHHLGFDNVVAYIDTDERKIGTEVLGKKIISYQTYKEKCHNIAVVLSTHEEENIKTLQNDGIYHFFCMSECPEDFQSSNPRNYLKENIVKTIDLEKKYVVYGETLYSILLFQWLKELSLKHAPYLLTDSQIENSFFTLLKKELGDNVKNNYTDISFTPDIVFITGGWVFNQVPEEYKGKVKNVLRFSETIKEYYNPELEKYKGIHKGQRCFIVATGSSITMEDLEVLKKNNEVCIGMNTILKIFDQTEWRPDYYVAQDAIMMRDYEKEILDLKDIVVFVSDGWAPFCEKVKEKENIIINHMGLTWNLKEEVPFSEDIAQICYICGTVTYSCIQFAVYMGFSEIYLLGVDFTSKSKDPSIYGHCHPEERNTMPYYNEQIEASYESAKRYSDTHSVKIYNATRGGLLENFERVDFDSLF